MAAGGESPFLYTGVIDIIAISGRNLISADANGFSDPYLKVTVVPDSADKKDKHRAKTKVCKKTLNPDWGSETMRLDFVGARSVLIKCKDDDAFGHNDPMGYAIVPFAELAAGREKDLVLRLLPDEGSDLPTQLGEIHIRICFTNTDTASRLAPVFDVRLQDAIARSPPSAETPHVPAFVKAMADAVVLKGGLSSEGIFRVPGNASEIQRIKESLNHGDPSPLDTASVESIAGAFKLWFRELAEPLFHNDIYAHCLSTTSGTRLILESLLPAPRGVLEFLLDTLLLFAEGEAATRMGVKNLAMVFGPALLRSPSDAAMLTDNDRVINFITLAINERRVDRARA